MHSRHRFGLAVGLVGLAALFGALAAPSLPSRLAIHWNVAGEPDGTMAALPALAFLPALTLGLIGLLALLPRIDPLGENVEAFRDRYDWFVVAAAAFLSVVHVGIVIFNLGYEFDFTLLVLAAVAILYYYVGVLLAHAERNWFVGVRTPWTLQSEAVWNRTNALAGRLFKLTAAITLVGLAFGDVAIYFLLVPTVAIALGTAAYSYYLYERLDEAEDDLDASSSS